MALSRRLFLQFQIWRHDAHVAGQRVDAQDGVREELAVVRVDVALVVEVL